MNNLYILWQFIVAGLSAFSEQIRSSWKIINHRNSCKGKRWKSIAFKSGKQKNLRQQWKPCISWNRKEYSDLHWVEKSSLLNTPTECCFSLSPHTWVLWFSLIGLLQWIGVPLSLPGSLCLLYCVTSDPSLLFQCKCYNRFENPYGWCRLTIDINFSRNFLFI